MNRDYKKATLMVLSAFVGAGVAIGMFPGNSIADWLRGFVVAIVVSSVGSYLVRKYI